MSVKIEFTTSQLKEAIDGTGGIMSNIAIRLKCDRGTAKTRIEEDPTALQFLADERENRLDRVESALMENIDNGDTTSQIFYLKTIGKSRGYIERRENQNTDAVTIEYKDVSK